MPYFHPSKNSRAGATDLYRNPIKVVLNKFSITATAGHGIGMYSHELNNVFFAQSQDRQIVFPAEGAAPEGIAVGYNNWFNGFSTVDTAYLAGYYDVPRAPLEPPVFNEALRTQLIDTRDTPLKFQSIAQSIPLTVSVHYNSYRFRIGAGATLERQYFKEFKPQSFTDRIRPFQPAVDPVLFQRYFGMLGYRFYDFWNFSFAAEGQIGVVRGGGKAYDYSVVQRGAFYNLGVSIEQNLSEYFRVILKPSYSFHRFNTNLNDDSGNLAPINIPHVNQSFFLQAGVSINIPDIRRCPYPACHIQLKHAHNGEELRGQPITKHQNPKIGQNHRKLFRYKWRNRRKMEPY